MKTIEQHFADWEGEVFGYGYGSGEEHILGALKSFLANTPEGPYDYREQENTLNPRVAWLLINVLCHCDMIEYGSSPRFGWLTKTGIAMREFVCERTAEQLAELTWQGTEYIHCYRDHCNCDDGDCRTRNPFWENLRQGNG